MKICCRRWVAFSSVAASVFLNVNCGGSSPATTGSAGNGGHAGAEAAGSGGHGGTAGGAGQAGGSGGTGGAAAGSGGSDASGGTGGSTGGSSGGSAGNNFDGGGFAAFSYTFDTGTHGFALSADNGPGNLVNISGATPPTLTWDSAVGHPTVGSIKVDATFTAYDQYVRNTLEISPPIDASGRTAQVYVMVDPADTGGESFSGGVRLEANSMLGGQGALGAFTSLTPGEWKLITLNLGSQAPPFDPSQIIHFGVNFSTGAGPDGGAFGAPVHAVFHIDSLTDGSGDPPPPVLNQTFGKWIDGFGLTANVADGAAPATLTWDSAVGSPHPGSLELTGTFNNFNQGMNVQVTVSPPADLTGKIIHAQVMLDPADAQAFGGIEVQVHASSAGFVYAAGAELELSPGVWTDVTLDLGAPFYAAAGFDPTQIVQVGVQVGTGTVPDGGVFAGPENLTFHIDSIIAQ